MTMPQPEISVAQMIEAVDFAAIKETGDMGQFRKLRAAAARLREMQGLHEMLPAEFISTVQRQGVSTVGIPVIWTRWPISDGRQNANSV